MPLMYVQNVHVSARILEHFSAYRDYKGEDQMSDHACLH
jgi:hypothetical protein